MGSRMLRFRVVEMFLGLSLLSREPENGREPGSRLSQAVTAVSPKTRNPRSERGFRRWTSSGTFTTHRRTLRGRWAS